MFRDLLNSQSRTPSPKKSTSKPAEKRTSTSKRAPAKAPSQTILGANTRFIGTLKSEGDVQVEDIFVGDIYARGRVVLGKQASLDGDLICEHAVIAGLVKGDVIARRITVQGTGRVLGDLRMEKLMTEEGSFIQGVITLEKKVDIAEVMEQKTRKSLGEEPIEENAKAAKTETVKESRSR